MNNSIKWENIYKTNKYLDSIFIKKYKDIDYYNEKNCIELLVEIGEFINETKCFKYWSIKEPNKTLCLEEYSDCIIMILYFYNILDMEIDFNIKHIDSDNILEVTNYIYNKATLLMNNCSKDLVKDLFNNIIYLGQLFNLDEKEILNSIEKKQKEISKRLSSTDY